MFTFKSSFSGFSVSDLQIAKTFYKDILGLSIPLFIHVKERLNLKLVDHQSFKCGNVLLIYHPKN